MIEIAPGWSLTVDRGPDWLFVRIGPQRQNAVDSPPLAECIWRIVEQHFTYRVVLELDELDVLPSYLIGQIVLLHKRLTSRGGVMRICGLSERNQQVLALSRLSSRFPNYSSRGEAVVGHWPGQPR